MNFLFFFLQHARRISPIFVHRNFDLVSIGRVSRRKERSPRNNVLERAFSNVPGGPRVYLRSAASAFFRRGLRPFSPSPLFFFPSIPARSVCRSSALIASKNVGRARVPRNVPMIFRPPNSHLSLTGHATNKISPAPPREIADAENTVSSRFCSPPPLILQEQDGEVRVIERFN